MFKNCLAMICFSSLNFLSSGLAYAQVDLLTSIKQDDVAALEKFINASGQPDSINGKDGLVPLVLAAQHNAVKSLHWLFAHGANVDARSGSGSTALSMAAYYGRVEMIHSLLSAGANIGHKSLNGYQAIDWALENQQLPAVEALILAWGQREAVLDAEKSVFKSANVLDTLRTQDAHFQTGWTSFPLVYAIVKNDIASVEYLLTRGFDPNQMNKAGYAPLPTAARLASPRIVELLLAYKADPNIGGSKGHDVAGALNQAIRGQRFDAAELLLKAGVDVNKPNAIGITPLYLSSVVDTEDGKITDLLLRYQAQIRQRADDGYDSLDKAIEARNRVFVRSAMWHLLRLSVSEKEQAEKLELLRQSGNGVQQWLSKASKESAILLLNYAIVKGDKRLFEQILKSKLNLNLVNRSGHFPLSLAASWSELAMVQSLLKKGASVNQKNDNKYQTSALMESTRDGNVDVAQVLLKHGAQVNLLDVNQDNALNWAVFFGRTSVVKLLLEHKANHAQVGQDSHDNALDIAVRQQFPEVILLLQKAGAITSKIAK